MSHAQITVIGPIGSGKTTVSQILATSLGLPLIDADTYENNPFLPSYIEDNARWSLATELCFTIARIEKLTPLADMMRTKSVVVDSGLTMSRYVYTKNHLVHGTMTAAEWELYCKIIDHYKETIPAPTVIVHLQASVPTQRTRILSRGRSYEKDYTDDYLQSITDRLDEYADSLRDDSTVRYIPIDTEHVDATTLAGSREIVQQIKSKLNSDNTSL